MADQAGRQAMRLLGDQSFIGLEYPVLGVQEFCPLVTAIVLAQRVGAGFSAELSSLIADGTWDAQILYQTRPWQRRVVPMALALPLGTLVLCTIAIVVWELGGIAVMLLRSNINPFTFFHPEVVTPSLLGLLTAKGLVFGLCIFAGSVSAAFSGRASVLNLNTATGDPGDVGRATADAVVRATLLCLLVNLVIDVAWFLA